ncbi:MAG: hypothetical protein ACKVP3_23065 [Hyphomicrobiaceae bacterium]
MADITKLEAAKRQLVTAIRLFFRDEDSVSIYTLTHAAWEVLDAICANRGLDRFRALTAQANSAREQDVRRAATYGRNFFKHAKEDPDAVLPDFSDDINDHVIFSATIDYGTVVNTKPVEIQVFQAWYWAAHVDKVIAPLKDNIDAAMRLFPGLAALARSDQKKEGLLVLHSASCNPRIMDDPSTDRNAVRSIE